MARPRSSANRSLIQLLGLTLILLVLPLGALSLITLEGYERYMGPELGQKASTVGRAVARRVERALALGIPLDGLVGVDAYLEPMVRDADDIGFIAILDHQRQVLHASGISVRLAQTLLASETGSAGADSSAPTGLRRAAAAVVDWMLGPGADQRADEDVRGRYLTTSTAIMGPAAIRGAGEQVGVLVVGVPLSFLGQQLEEIAFDTAIVLAVALLIAFELLLLVISNNLTFPLGLARGLMTDLREGRTLGTIVTPVRNEVGRLIEELNQVVETVGRRSADGALRPPAPTVRRSNLVVVRSLAFLFVVAEELARPFLPVYVEGFVGEVGFASEAVLVGLPLSLFMAVAALSMALAGPLLDHIDRRRTFLIGAMVATAGLLGTALAQGYYDLLFWRAVAGAGYGLTFVACQGYVIDHTTGAVRAQGISMFVGGIMAADICGPAIGGILADRIGFSSTLLLGGGTALIAGLLVYALMQPPATGQRPIERGSLLAGLRVTRGNWRLLAVLLLAAVPAKLVLTGFLFYQVPLYLTALGSSQSEIGRIVMTYGLVAVVATPLFAYWADRARAHGLLIGIGGILSGVGLLPALFGESPERVFLAVLALGIGQSMSIPALFAVVTRVGRREIAAVGQASVLGVFRLAERLGAALGPFLVAGLLSRLDHAAAQAVMGVVAIACAVLFSTVLMAFGAERERGFQAPASSAGGGG